MGGAAVDVLARTKEFARRNNSNIGIVEIKYGGTSRNVAEWITRLGFGSNLKFITTVNKSDAFGHILQRSFEKLGMRTDGIYFSEFPTAVFCAVMDVHGGLEIGVNDMECHLNLPLSHIDNSKDDIINSDVVLVDANIKSETILYTLEMAKPVKWTIVEPISAEKSKKILFNNILPLISILKPNDDQYDDLFFLFSKQYSVDISEYDNKKMSQEEQFLYKAKIIFEISETISKQYNCINKLEYIVVTCGKKGIRFITKHPFKHYHLPVKKIDDTLFVAF